MAPRKSSRKSKAQTPDPEAEEAQVVEEAADTTNVDNEEENIEDVPSTSSKRKAGKGVASRKKKAAVAKPAAQETEEVEEAEESLFAIVKTGAAIELTVADWVSRYENNSSEALVELINFLVESCGCPGRVSSEDLEEEDANSTHERLMNSFTEKNTDQYPISGRDKNSKKFLSHFAEFWTKLISNAPRDILFDLAGNFAETLLNWIVILSSSKVRAFRHTATVAGLSVIKGYITVAIALRSEFELASKQMDIEKKGKRSQSKAKSLQADSGAIHDQIVKVESEVIGEYWKGLFLHRYRDLVTEIRAESMEALGQWMLEYPSLFLKDNYLKYVGWTLNDSDAPVRLSSVRALFNLLRVPDNMSNLSFFLERFKARVIELATDVDVSVSSEALRLNTLLLKHNFLNEEEVQSLSSCLWDSQDAVRASAADFVAMRLFKIDNVSGRRKGSSDDDDERDNAADLLELVKFVSEAQPVTGEERVLTSVAYPVDALWESVDLLHDWNTYLKVLLPEKKRKGDATLTDDQLAVAVLLLRASVAKVTGNPILPGLKGFTTKSQKERVSAMTEEMTTVLAAAMPDLLRRYAGDGVKIAALAAVPQYFDLNVYHSHQLSKHFGELLTALQDQFSKHPHEDACGAICQTLSVLIDQDHPNKKKVSAVVTKIEDDLKKEYGAAFKGTSSKKQQRKDDKEEYSQLACMVRISSFAQYHDANNLEIFGDLMKSLEFTADKDVYSDDLTKYLMKSIVQQLAWALLSGRTGDALIELRERRDNAVDVFLKLLKHDSEEVKREAADSIALLLELSQTVPSLEVEFNEDLCASFIDYITEVLGSIPEDDLSAEQRQLVRDVFKIITALTVTYNEHATKYCAPRLLPLMIHPNKSLVGECFKAWWSTLRSHSDRVAEFQATALVNLNEEDLERTHALATRLAMSYFAPGSKKSEVAFIVSEGIKFAFTSSKDVEHRLSTLHYAVLPFIRFLSDVRFAERLLQELREEAERAKTRNPSIEDSEDWVHVSTVEEALARVIGGQTPAKQKATPKKATPKKTARSRKRLDMERVPDSPATEEEDQQEESIEDEDEEQATQEFPGPSKSRSRKRNAEADETPKKKEKTEKKMEATPPASQQKKTRKRAASPEPPKADEDGWMSTRRTRAAR